MSIRLKRVGRERIGKVAERQKQMAALAHLPPIERAVQAPGQLNHAAVIRLKQVVGNRVLGQWALTGGEADLVQTKSKFDADLIAHKLTHVMQQNVEKRHGGRNQDAMNLVQCMFGRNPERNALTHQPRGEYEVNREMCIDVMDELALTRNDMTDAIAIDLGNAWWEQRASIRDFPHAGGPDIRLHMTVVVARGQGQGTYHVPRAIASRPGCGTTWLLLTLNPSYLPYF